MGRRERPPGQPASQEPTLPDYGRVAAAGLILKGAGHTAVFEKRAAQCSLQGKPLHAIRRPQHNWTEGGATPAFSCHTRLWIRSSFRQPAKRPSSLGSQDICKPVGCLPLVPLPIRIGTQLRFRGKDQSQ
jgi:hypothetical protein